MRDYSRDTGTSRIRPPELAGRGESGRQPGEGEVGLTSPFRCIDLTFRKAVALRRGAWPPVQPRASEPGRRPSRNAWSTSPRPEGWRGTTAGVVPATAARRGRTANTALCQGGVLTALTACGYVSLRATAARSCFVIAPGGW